MEVLIRKSTRNLQGEITLPSSKSISNRLLIIQALCEENFQVENLSLAHDTVLMKELLIEIHKNELLGRKSHVMELDAENAGTVFRFITAFLAAKPGVFMLDGDARMRERPVGELVDALNKLGADIEYTAVKSYPPINIKGKILKGGEVEINAGISSQFVSALLMIAPTMVEGLTIQLKGSISSKPYIKMTISLMEQFGANVEWINNTLKVAGQAYSSGNISVEGDWSAASYWYLMAAFSEEVNLVLEGLQKDSIQGDAVIADVFKNFGVETVFIENGIRLSKSKYRLKNFKFDFTNYPDLVQAVAVCCAGLNIPAKLSGLQSLKIKETDRLSALKNELRKLGNIVEVRGDELSILPSGTNIFTSGQNLTFKTYNDHRMAMALAPLSILFPEIIIEDPAVVSKSYPGFWDDMQKLGFDLTILKKHRSMDASMNAG
ncbi:MAG: 3-phosphoshikimate 1-carboxyvinyltransferase [Bacteroidales bacterium]|nr:3-phosphoshikimate 1-carboxyvinyltransferase [Bacteroidales bacterium]